MKKRILYTFLFTMFLILSFSSKVDAQSISSKDIENRTYVIGEHMYNRDVTEEYAGILTTQYIMYGSSTVNSKNISEFIIYYKNSFGEWRNALTNEIVSAPEFFDIQYKNGKQCVNIKYGDADGDGKVSKIDLLKLQKYLEGLSVDIAEKANLDVNGDGNVNEADKVLLQKYLAGWYSDKNLPDEPLGKTYVISYNVNGNSEERFSDYELEGHLVRKPEDPDNNGQEFDGWYLNGVKYNFDTPITENIELEARFVKPQYGDVNCDGQVSKADLLRFQKYLAGWTVDIPKKANLDVNGDGSINEADKVLLQKYLAGWYSDKNLPDEPLGKAYAISYNINDNSEESFTDYELEGHLVTRPKDPDNNGQEFDGWYLNGVKYNFDTPITENIELEARFVKPQYGDVNCDGQVSKADLLGLQKYLAGWTVDIPKKANLDINADGYINEIDVSLLQKYLAGWDLGKDLPDGPIETWTVEYKIGKEHYNWQWGYVGRDSDISVADPTKDGYVFDGWYTDEELENKYTDSKVSKDMKLYAKFTQQ